jgi:hypothetical protein
VIVVDHFWSRLSQLTPANFGANISRCFLFFSFFLCALASSFLSFLASFAELAGNTTELQAGAGARAADVYTGKFCCVALVIF